MHLSFKEAGVDTIWFSSSTQISSISASSNKFPSELAFSIIYLDYHSLLSLFFPSVNFVPGYPLFVPSTLATSKADKDIKPIGFYYSKNSSTTLNISASTLSFSRSGKFGITPLPPGKIAAW